MKQAKSRVTIDAIDQFATEAETFAKWAEKGMGHGESAVRVALIRLAQLFAAGQQLAALKPGSTECEAEMRVTVEEWGRIFNNALQLPLDQYGEVFNPLNVPPDSSLIASLADDIADIYRDVVTGLRYFQAGHREEAAWQWAFLLHVHWGEHVTGAMRALEGWLRYRETEPVSKKPKQPRTRKGK